MPVYGRKLILRLGIDCLDIKKKGQAKGDGMYWLDPDGRGHANAFLAYCDMTSYDGGWTMCYTTADYVKPRIEVKYSPQFPFGSDGYRTNCNNIPVSCYSETIETVTTCVPFSSSLGVLI